MISYKFFPVFTLLFVQVARAQTPRFVDSLTHIAANIDGKLGIAVTIVDSNTTVLIHGHDHFPMMSVFKFPIALYVLHLVDQRKMVLVQTIRIRKSEWQQHSPLLDRYKGLSQDQLDFTLRDLLSAMVIKGDNVACDVLLKTVGGPSVVNEYIHSLGIDEINIAHTETEMAADPKKVYENWCTPAAMNKLLQEFYQGHLLHIPSTSLLIQYMTECTTGPHRLKGLLGEYSYILHRTGTSDTDANGLTAATNDVGIIPLMTGGYLCVSVFLTDSHASEADRDKTLALIGRFANDSYTYIRIR